MENKITVYNDFLKNLKAAITTAAVYFKEHPSFVKSAENLKVKINETLFLVNPLRIGITPDYLLIDREHLENEKLYKELIDFFHRRKVKSIEIKENFSFEELTNFLTQAGLPPKDILMRGGLGNILRKKGASHITVQDLDYSRLLEGEGEECKDIWLYLLKENLQQGNAVRIEELADNFKNMSGKVEIKSLLDDEETGTIISKFFAYLKDTDKDRFHECVRDLTRSILKSKHSLELEKADKIKLFLNALDGNDFSDILLEQFQSGRSIDSLNFSLFSQLVGIEKHKEISSSFADKFEKQKQLKSNPQIAAKVKELFFSSTAHGVSEIYRQNLISAFESISLGEGSSFDRRHLKDNFRLVLLDLFVLESGQRLNSILDSILIELEEAAMNNNTAYIKSFIEIFGQKRKELSSSSLIFAEVDKQVSAFLENVGFAQNISLNFKDFINILETSALGTEFYLEKIFKENKVDAGILSAFFKFFPENSGLFYKNLDKKSSDIKFIKIILESLKEIKLSWGLAILQHIFSSSNKFIGIEVLKIMKGLPLCDEEFLFSILKKADFIQRKHAFLNLIQNSKTREKTAQLLLSISNPFGTRSRIIEENLELIDVAPFAEAESYLRTLAGYRYFWNRGIRKKALEILKKYNG